MSKTKRSVEEMFNDVMKREFEELFKEESVADYVRRELNEFKKSLINNFLGIERGWRDWEFKSDSIFLKNMQHLKNIVPEILEKYGIGDIEFTVSDIKSLKKLYKDKYMGELNNLIESYAEDNARSKFNETLVKLGLNELEDDEYVN